MKPILISGPTASGKSALAIEVAKATDGVVINADLMQCYREWHVLTARPSPEDEAEVSHALYGFIPVAEHFTVGDWLRKMVETLAALDGKRAIICGGSGLCFTALTKGLSNIPSIHPKVRAEAEAVLDEIGLSAFYQAYAARDPEGAKQLDPENPRRVLRAWEVLQATARTLADWNSETAPPVVPEFDAVVLDVEPARLRERIAMRFDQMIDQGALDEVRAVAALDLLPNHPSMKAHGAPHLMAHLRGKMSLADAIARSKIDTNQYAKRQRTWFRNQAPDWLRIDPLDRTTVDAVVPKLAAGELSGT